MNLVVIKGMNGNYEYISHTHTKPSQVPDSVNKAH